MSVSYGQCPDKPTLWNRLVTLRDAGGITATQLDELRKVEKAYHDCHAENDSTFVFLLERIGKAYVEQGNFPNAISYYNRAIRVINDNAGNTSINPRQLVTVYFRFAGLYGALRRSSDKIRAYDSCIAVARRLGTFDQYALYALREKVTYLMDVGEYTAAIQYAAAGENISLDKSRLASTGASVSSKEYYLNFMVARVNALLLLKRYDEAEQRLVQAIGICNSSRLEKYLGSLYHQLANAQTGAARYGRTIHYLDLALQYNLKWGISVDCKAATANIGYYYYSIARDYRKALNYYNKALTYQNANPVYDKTDSLNSLNIYNNIANVYVARQRFDSAHYFFQRAFDHIKKSATEDDVLHSSLDVFVLGQKVEYLTSLFIDKGDAFFNEYKKTGAKPALLHAIRMYRMTDSLLDKIKSTQSEMQSKLFWRNNTHRLYERAIEASLAAGDAADAFYFFERSRAILLSDQLDERKWLGEDVIVKQAMLNSQVNRLDKQLLHIPQQSREYAQLQGERLSKKELLNSLVRQIRKKNELYYQSFLDTSFTTLKDMRSVVLKDHQALVEVFTGDSTVFTMVITPAQAYLRRIPRGLYDSVANDCMNRIADPEKLNQDFTRFTRSANYLYRLIFQDIPLPAGRIVISPDGKYFPFEALVTGMRGNNPVYFIERHAVSYTYSARYLMNHFAGSAKLGTRSFLGLAPVRFPSAAALASLPGSDRSVRAVSALFSDADTLIGAAATRQNFLSQFSHHKIIQLYTHSSDSSSEGEPVIYFADTCLYLSDLSSDTKPITNLVVLSACETGNGQFYKGEGVFGFNRAFAALGIPSCINTLWSVDNLATYQLTERFYAKLLQGLPIDVALQQAKLGFIRQADAERQLPYYWAASILAGKTAAPSTIRNNRWVWAAAILVLAAGSSTTVWLTLRRRRKKKDGLPSPVQDKAGTVS